MKVYYKVMLFLKLKHTLPPQRSGRSPADLLVISIISFLSKFKKTGSFCMCLAKVRPKESASEREKKIPGK